jgi:hypothetical protein
MTELVANDRPLLEIQDTLSKKPATGAVLVSRRTLHNALSSYLDRKIGAAELIGWANLVEQHGDEIAYESGFQKLIATCIFRLSTPEINQPVDEKLCQELIGAIALRL